MLMTARPNIQLTCPCHFNRAGARRCALCCYWPGWHAERRWCADQVGAKQSRERRAGGRAGRGTGGAIGRAGWGSWGWAGGLHCVLDLHCAAPIPRLSSNSGLHPVRRLPQPTPKDAVVSFFCCCHHSSLPSQHCMLAANSAVCSCGWEDEPASASAAVGSDPQQQPQGLHFGLSTLGSAGPVLAYSSSPPSAVTVAGGGSVRFQHEPASGALRFDVPPGLPLALDWAVAF